MNKVTLDVKSIKLKNGRVYLTLSHPRALNYPSLVFEELMFYQIQGELVKNA